MKNILLALILLMGAQVANAQKFQYGKLVVPSEALSAGNISNSTMTMSDPNIPQPELFYHKTENVLTLYTLSLKADKSFNGCEIIRIHTQNITKANFKVDFTTKGDETTIDLFTKGNNVMDMATLFYFDPTMTEPTYSLVYQISLAKLNKTKSTDLATLLLGLAK